MGPKGIAFCVVKNQMYAQISEVDEALKNFNNVLYRVNEGHKYDCDEVNKSWAWLEEKIAALKSGHIKGLAYSETCPCSSDLRISGFTEDGDPFCTSCEETLELGNLGL